MSFRLPGESIESLARTNLLAEVVLYDQLIGFLSSEETCGDDHTRVLTGLVSRRGEAMLAALQSEYVIQIALAQRTLATDYASFFRYAFEHGYRPERFSARA